MQTPDHDARHACVFRLQRDQVADAGFVEPATVVHDQHIPGLRALESLQEYIDTADVTDRKYPATTTGCVRQRTQARGPASHWSPGA